MSRTDSIVRMAREKAKGTAVAGAITHRVATVQRHMKAKRRREAGVKVAKPRGDLVARPAHPKLNKPRNMKMCPERKLITRLNRVLFRFRIRDLHPFLLRIEIRPGLAIHGDALQRFILRMTKADEQCPRRRALL